MDQTVNPQQQLYATRHNPSQGVQTSATLLDVGALSVDEWVDRDDPVEIVLRRKRDGLEIRLCPTRESYRSALAEGVIALMPSEVQALVNAEREAGEDADKRAALGALVDRAVVVKQCIPGAKLSKLLGFGEENA